MHPLKDNKIELFRDGWTVLKNIFSTSEIKDIRKKAETKDSIDSLQSDILSNPAIGNLVYDERIVSSVEYLLDGSLSYFGEGRLLIENKNGRKGGSFHRDNPDRNEPYGPDWKSRYDVVRVGIYLEDHKNHAEGLGLFSGSNKNSSFLPKGLVLPDNAPITAGDVLVWTLTTMHVGYPKKIKFLRGNKSIARASEEIYGKKYFFNNLLYKYLPSILFLPKGKKRLVIHIVYGKSGSKHTERYIEYCKRRDYATNRWAKTIYRKNTISEINNSRLKFIDFSSFIPNENSYGDGKHFQLPFIKD